MGNHKYISTPEMMWKLFESYRENVKAHPREKMVFVGKDGDMKREQLERPLTMEGFELYVAELDERMPFGLQHYFANTGDAYRDFLTICSRIRMAIRDDQIQGGMVGQYNPSITQRLNGLVEKREIEVREQPLFPDVAENDGDK